jgi:hypothetical protein
MQFNWWEGLAAGAVATVAMTVLMQMGAAMGMTRMNMALMLGSMFRRDPESARSVGMTLHFMNGPRSAFSTHSSGGRSILPISPTPGGSVSSSAPCTGWSRWP